MGESGAVFFRSNCLGLRLCLGRHFNHPRRRSALSPQVSVLMLLTFPSGVFYDVLYRNWFVRWITGASVQTVNDDPELGSDDEDDDDKKDEEKKTIKERLQAIQEVSQTVQNTIGFLASLGESVKK